MKKIVCAIYLNIELSNTFLYVLLETYSRRISSEKRVYIDSINAAETDLFMA